MIRQFCWRCVKARSWWPTNPWLCSCRCRFWACAAASDSDSTLKRIPPEKHKYLIKQQSKAKWQEVNVRILWRADRLTSSCYLADSDVSICVFEIADFLNYFLVWAKTYKVLNQNQKHHGRTPHTTNNFFYISLKRFHAWDHFYCVMLREKSQLYLTNVFKSFHWGTWVDFTRSSFS